MVKILPEHSFKDIRTIMLSTFVQLARPFGDITAWHPGKFNQSASLMEITFCLITYHSILIRFHFRERKKSDLTSNSSNHSLEILWPFALTWWDSILLDLDIFLDLCIRLFQSKYQIRAILIQNFHFSAEKILLILSKNTQVMEEISKEKHLAELTIYN